MYDSRCERSKHLGDVFRSHVTKSIEHIPGLYLLYGNIYYTIIDIVQITFVIRNCNTVTQKRQIMVSR